jgi:putative ABC transport system ATP-binding protein
VRDEPYIIVDRAVKTYRVGDSVVRALDGMDLTIDKGEMCALMGPSGAGKTTLLNIMGGLDTPDSGKITVGNIEVNRLGEGQRARFRKSNVGFIFQFFNLIPSLTALENVLVPVMFESNTFAYGAEDLLERVGLGQRMDHLPGMLSGGERQRVAIARSLINDPMIILADEPTGNIDSETAKEIVKLFKELNDEGKTLILATHDRLIAGRAQTMVKMRDGKIVKGKRPPKDGMIHLRGRS